MNHWNDSSSFLHGYLNLKDFAFAEIQIATTKSRNINKNIPKRWRWKPTDVP